MSLSKYVYVYMSVYMYIMYNTYIYIGISVCVMGVEASHLLPGAALAAHVVIYSWRAVGAGNAQALQGLIQRSQERTEVEAFGAR